MRRRPSRSCTSVDRAGSTAVGTSGWLVPNRPVSRFSRSTTVSRSACSRSSPAARPWSSPERAQPLDAGHRRVGGQVAVGLAARAVDDQPGQRHLLGAQPLDEVRRLAQARPARARRPPGTPYAGPGAARRCASARCRNPPKSVSNAATNAFMSWSTWAPMILVIALVTIPKPAVISRAGPRAGRQQQLHEPAVEEAREPLGGVEEVQRAPRRRGVHDDQVPATGALRRPCRAGRASPSPCTPACPRTSSTPRCRRGCFRICSAFSGLAWLCTTSSKVRFMSSIIASSEPPPLPCHARAPAAGCCRATRCPSTAPAGGPGRW